LSEHSNVTPGWSDENSNVASGLSVAVAGPEVTLVCGDLFAALNRKRKFDLIVSNPPYIAEDQIGQLEPEVGRAEPYLALSGGPTGLRSIEQIATGAQEFLHPGGSVFLEIGADQKNAVEALFKAGRYGEVRVINDWAGQPRVLQARYAPGSW
jgi:release factor glutamine methyltransferase